MMNLFNLILHLDVSLQAVVDTYSSSAYLLLFVIIFLETGIVLTPFLPGDSLLFAAGALAGTGSFQIEILFPLLLVAAIMGDTLNYHIGKHIGPKIFKKESSIFFHKEHLVRAEAFYEKYGKKTIILARFIPVVRTFAPFVAGIGRMPYGIFLLYNILGACIWCSLFVFGGFFFGNIPWVKEHFGLLILAIILLSFIPMIKELVIHFWKKNPV